MVNPNRRQEIADHRIRPALITFPLAFFVATFICDLVYWGSGYDAWATAAIWLLGAGDLRKWGRSWGRSRGGV